MSDLLKSVPPPVSIPDDEIYEDFLEWTPEEEEAFLSILNNTDDSFN